MRGSSTLALDEVMELDSFNFVQCQCTAAPPHRDLAQVEQGGSRSAVIAACVGGRRTLLTKKPLKRSKSVLLFRSSLASISAAFDPGRYRAYEAQVDD